jgi:phosphate-selective porin
VIRTTLRLAVALCALVSLAPRPAHAAPPEEGAGTTGAAASAGVAPSPVIEVSPGPSAEPTPHVPSVGLPEGLPRAQLFWDRGGGYRFLRQQTIEFDESGMPRVVPGQESLVEGHVGFRLHVDGAGFVERAGIEPIDDDVQVRRAFLTTNGVVHLLHPVQYNVEVGLLGGQFYLDSAWVMWRDVPWIGTLKLGAFDAPIGFDNLVSSRDRTFMEVAAPIEAFVPSSSPGIQARRTFADGRGSWALGWFTVGQRRDVGDQSRALARVVGRTTWLAHDEAEVGEQNRLMQWLPLLHLGVGASYTFAGSHEVQYEARPESFLAPVAVDTGKVDARQAFVFDAEFAARRGPLSFQAEYLHAFVDGNVENFGGFYIAGAYLITGEVRPYDRERAVFGQVLPRRPLDPHTWGLGALECASRYSWVNLDHSPVAGGRMHVLSAGLNWYWNAYVRWQFDYELALVDGGPLDGRLHVFQARFQLVF